MPLHCPAWEFSARAVVRMSVAKRKLLTNYQSRTTPEAHLLFLLKSPVPIIGGLMRGLTGKRILITGGASGIGAATAARFLEEGSAVCVLDRDAKAGEAIRKQLPDLSGVLGADVSSLSQVRRAVEDSVSQMGGLDVVVNNAGISIRHN